jgi:hypothetical protein
MNAHHAKQRVIIGLKCYRAVARLIHPRRETGRPLNGYKNFKIM